MIRLIVSAARHTFSYPQIAIWMLIALGATVMGPFGTYFALDWVSRAVYWFLLCGCSVFLAYLVHNFTRHFIGEDESPLMDAVHICSLTAVFSPFVYGLNKFMAQNNPHSTPGFWRIVLLVFVVSVLITAIRRLHHLHQNAETGEEMSGSIFMEADVARPVDTGDPVSAQADAHKDCRLHSRLPPGMREPILHLSARDHFVDVETATALYSLRMRFSDAVAEMDGVDGYATHRSHWVATGAIREPLRESGKQFLVLVNGTKVPVSRSFHTQLEEAGLL